jgi:hypothetical protein
MKKTVKKLVLAKETVQALDGAGLGLAAGGATTSWNYYRTCACANNAAPCPPTQTTECIC